MLNNRGFWFITLIFCFTPGIGLLAQGLPFKNFSIQSGLSQSVVNDIHQDSDGYIWIATEYGLNRFNRFQFVSFFEDNGLSHNNILVIYEDSQKRLLVGTESGISYRTGDRFSRLPGTELLNRVQVNSLMEDSGGGLWVGTESVGIFYFRDDSFITINSQNGLTDNSIRKIVESQNGDIYAATREGVVVIRNGNILEVLTEDDGLADSAVRDIFEHNDGSLWIATRNGLSVRRNGTFTTFRTEEGLINNRVTALTSDEGNGVWIATEGGLSHYREGRIFNYNDATGLSNNIVFSVFRDFENNLWAGTYGGGVDLLTGEKFMHYTVQQGLLSNMITGFAQTSDGAMWISTYGGGIARRLDREIVNFTIADGLIDNRVFMLFYDKNARLWAGTRSGISYLSNGRFYPDPRNQSLPDPKVRTIIEDRNGNTWIGTYGGGLAQYRGQQLVQVYNTRNGLADDIVMRVIEASDGSIWVAGYGGVSIIRDNEISILNTDNGLIHNSVLTVFEDNRQRILIGTFGGISIYDNGSIENISTDNGLPNNVCYFIEQDERGNIWIGTNHGLVRMNPDLQSDIDDPSRFKDEVRFKRYTTESGLSANETNSNAVFKDNRGYLWIGTVGGANHFRWHLDMENTIGPPVHIERIRLFDRDLIVDRNFVFKHDQNFIGFDFVGLSYGSPSEVIYEYRLRGIDQNWQRTSDRSVRYTTLPGGEFRFEVRARNNDGYWSPRATLTFRIDPPFWRSWWFILLVTIITLFVAGFLYNYYRISKQVDLERIRIRIASDLHDDVGASLTEIALQADFLQATQKDVKLGESLMQIGEMSRKIVTTMDDIVWSIDARNDTFGDLLDRMQDYASNVLLPKDIEPEFHFVGIDSSKSMPLETRQNLYLIFKEAVNNASKHSRATKIEIRFEVHDGKYLLEIKDNGVGMPESVRAGGHGMKNMKLRAARIKAEIDLENNNGLKITVTGKAH